MKIELHEIPIRDVCAGFAEDGENGVKGYGGRLDIRPAYQREFVYKDELRNAVIDTIRNGFPLNVMYWVKNPDGTFEVMDGQQRTISFCRYVDGKFSIVIDGMTKAFHNLTAAEQERILDYKLLVYFCEGSDEEKLKWFEIINIAGLTLTAQERRNAVYTGPWLTHAKSIFSRSSGAAYGLAEKYVTGEWNRQAVLETAIRWISKNDITGYMSAHQHDPNANELWAYFRSVIYWVQDTFPKYRTLMKGIDWAALYDEYHGNTYDTQQLEARIQALLMDDDVTAKKGVYAYVLTGDERALSIRAFTPAQKQAAYERQGSVCVKCRKHFDIEDMEGDHIIAWSRGGHTTPDNCQMLCRRCNATKSDV